MRVSTRRLKCSSQTINPTLIWVCKIKTNMFVVCYLCFLFFRYFSVILMKYSFVKFLSLIRQISSLLLQKSSTENGMCDGSYVGVIETHFNNETIQQEGPSGNAIQPSQQLAPYITLKSGVNFRCF
jgi:hypothetical protein